MDQILHFVSLAGVKASNIDLLLMAQMTEALDKAHRPRIVNSQPLPMDKISGAPTMPPVQLKMLRMKLLRATPEEDRWGMNSVNIVVAIAKMSMEPMP